GTTRKLRKPSGGGKLTLVCIGGTEQALRDAGERAACFHLPGYLPQLSASLGFLCVLHCLFQAGGHFPALSGTFLPVHIAVLPGKLFCVIHSRFGFEKAL